MHQAADVKELDTLWIKPVTNVLQQTSLHTLATTAKLTLPALAVTYPITIYLLTPGCLFVIFDSRFHFCFSSTTVNGDSKALTDLVLPQHVPTQELPQPRQSRFSISNNKMLISKPWETPNNILAFEALGEP
ncbi:uncharacterized protein F5147DRAFT_653420 [Suillus discolor]|uniref:Uncharacterized protein n=1 Tax=Suillus discolor TaxID=1912936 RepID=A0A9P7F6B0_9AGAM|nr:uncharacterized protein F5147DRAFT_653420 [Suillus discolor]KAG2107187.1 hypothetical protein F5147DRAFT_653420 [Suillus discolor]